MKTIGLLGGMSWESTSGYYRTINEGIKDRLGGLHSAQIVMFSVDFDPIEKLLHEGDWEEITNILSGAAERIEAAGADFLLICTNTMHKVAPQIEDAINIPFLHIADATGEILVSKNIKTVGLLGTAFTMEQAFYKGRIEDRFGLKILIPSEVDRRIIHDVIFKELCLGEINPESKQQFLGIIETLSKKGAEGVILGCTEIGMLVNQTDTEVALFDTTEIHAEAAVEKAIND